jgi:hypothetical protein
MSIRTLRKKTSRQKRKALAFTLVVEGQAMRVCYKANWMTDVGHFEFRSPFKPARRIPVSSTGYLSHIASMDDVKASKSPQRYAREVVLAALSPRRSNRPDESKQLSLFA